MTVSVTYFEEELEGTPYPCSGKLYSTQRYHTETKL